MKVVHMMDGVTLLIKAPRLIAWQRHLPSSPTLFPTALTLQVRLSQRCRGVFWCYEASGIQNRSRATLKARQCLAWGLLSPFSSFFGEGIAKQGQQPVQHKAQLKQRHSSGSKSLESLHVEKIRAFKKQVQQGTKLNSQHVLALSKKKSCRICKFEKMLRLANCSLMFRKESKGIPFKNVNFAIFKNVW